MNPETFRILLVDDEKDILEFLGYNLRQEGYKVSTASSGLEAIKQAKEIQPHLILLDVMMPGMDGMETCEKIRQVQGLENTVIAFLTARGEDFSQIAGFEAGGDDYIIKPIKPRVLLSRIAALLKRAEQSMTAAESEKMTGKDIVIDRERYLVIKEGKELLLPRKEFELLALLLSRPGKVFTRDEIFRQVWGDDVIVGDRTLDVHIRKLREKLGDTCIQTVKGVGYKFVD